MMRVTTMAIFLSVFAYAQKTHTINGVIKDKDTGELIPGALIKVKELPEINVQTNEYGFYSISLPEGDYTLDINYLKHIEATKKIHLAESMKMNWDLERQDGEIEEVEIKKRTSIISNKTKTGAEVLDVQAMSKLPVIFGEKDIIKTLQFLPGISAQEGSSGFSVRGGNTDQNLFLLDEAPVFNNSHLLGFFSIFNSDALRSVTVYKENIPSQYGGRLSSIIDVKMKEGNNQKYNVTGGIGLISSRLSVEGPLQKGKSSFIISARRTYADILYNAIAKPTPENKVKLYFYDINAKLNYKINENNSLYFSSYFGRDVLGFKEFKNNWGNLAGTLRWNSILGDKLFSNTSLVFSNYDYKSTIEDNKGGIVEVNPNVRNLIFKQDFTHNLNLQHSLRYGFQSSYYIFNTPNLPETVTSDFLRQPRSMWENAVYINDDFKITDKLFANYGFRLSSISSGDNSVENQATTNFKKNYINFEPRIAFNYEFNKDNIARFGYTRNTQNIQTLVANGGLNDVWINLRKPQIADQINAGYTRKLNDTYELNADVYYKKMQNLADYKDGLQVNVMDNIKDNLLYNGQGRAYGLELMLKKNRGRLTGWVAYTLSKSQRRIDGINDNAWYNANQDRTHDLSIVSNYELSPKWTVSGAFVFHTGNAVTYPVGKYEIGGNTVLDYGKRNSDRMPSYQRLDLNFTYEAKNNNRFKSSWSFGVYNIYGRKNPYAITFGSDKISYGKVEATQFSFFSMVPNVSYNFKF
ncbi:carboxypeptidase-like regulatory domain-containing protein [Chryseobacterium sp. G0201]|uniref:TonB-dependent receptor n=1 Tax=Chryseobacterium sp. G0201 TaxID=2487065 RepID=UPI000F4FFA14|nr:carboxypeptidase-like regulatory domain-containing protein [Chryseobacterium sp. G0201]AZA52744.1 TonB-dependent receptor [Chryseobacterium sp. G0201]